MRVITGIVLLASLSVAGVCRADVDPAPSVRIVLPKRFGEIHAGVDRETAMHTGMVAGNQVGAQYAANPNVGPAAGAAGGLIGGLIVGAMIANSEQKAADAEIRPLTSLASPEEISGAIETGIRDAFNARGPTDVTFDFDSGMDRLGHVRRFDFKAFDQACFLKNTAGHNWKNSMVWMTRDHRSLHLAMTLNCVANGTHPAYSQAVEVITEPSPVTAPSGAIEAAVKQGKSALLERIRDAVRMVVGAALAGRRDVNAAPEEVVKFLDGDGEHAMRGKLMSQHDGYIEVVDASGAITIVSAQQVL